MIVGHRVVVCCCVGGALRAQHMRALRVMAMRCVRIAFACRLCMCFGYYVAMSNM